MAAAKIAGRPLLLVTAALIFFAVATYLGVNERVYDISTVGRRPGGIFLRKAVSVIVFAVAGIFSETLAAPRPSRGLKRPTVAALGGFLLSAVIEFFQYPEAAEDILLDLGCGLAGGTLGHAVLRLAAKVRARRGASH